MAIYLWLLGFFSAFMGPGLFFPTSLGATLTAWALTAGLFLHLKSKVIFDRECYAILLGALLLSLIPSIYTNNLIVTLAVCGWALSVLLAIMKALDPYKPNNIFSFCAGVLTIMLATIGNCFDRNTYRQLLPKFLVSKKLILPTGIFWSSCVAAFLILMFHSLFAEINSDYANFIAAVIKVFLEIISIALILKTLIFSLLCSSFALVIHSENNSINKAAKTGLKITIILTPLVILFGVFSLFQGRLLLTDSEAIPFKELSLYTQKGFWELLIVAFIGYGVFCYSVLTEDFMTKSDRLLKFLLYVFVCELTLVAFFTIHKLYLLQLDFGLKDTRLIASCAAILILFTCLLCFVKLLTGLTDQRIFKLQYSATLLILLVVSFINVESVITKYNPIRYAIQNRWQVDYSYMLQNSLDNYTYWPSIMSTAKRTGISYPKDYYWGSYHSLCNRKRIESLDSFYGMIEQKAPVKSDIRSFNLTTYRARQHVNSYRAEYLAFIEFVKERCGGKFEIIYSSIYSNHALQGTNNTRTF